MAKWTFKKAHYSTTKRKALGSTQGTTVLTPAQAAELVPKPRKRPEEEFQEACVKWFDEQYPEYANDLFHVPNGGLRSTKTAKTMKRLGTRKSIPDLFFQWKGQFYVIEMKSLVGSLDKDQKVLHERWKKDGVKMFVLKGDKQDISPFKQLITSIINGNI